MLCMSFEEFVEFSLFAENRQRFEWDLTERFLRFPLPHFTSHIELRILLTLFTLVNFQLFARNDTLQNEHLIISH